MHSRHRVAPRSRSTVAAFIQTRTMPVALFSDRAARAAILGFIPIARKPHRVPSQWLGITRVLVVRHTRVSVREHSKFLSRLLIRKSRHLLSALKPLTWLQT